MTGALVLAALLAPMTLVTAVNLLAAPRLHRLRPSTGGPRVSVLVPARDEAANLRRLLPALLASEYADLEIVVLDDESADETGAVGRGFAASDRRVRVIDGTPPPEGWTGKNWACHRLAESATGEVLLFCDADMVPGARAVARTVAALEQSKADALTALPRHDSGGRFQQAVIPLIATVPVLGLLPLPLVPRTRAPSVSMGNGQWFAWRRPAYDRAGGHARVRSDVLEDVRLARLAKRAGLRLAVYVASRDLSVRMYGDRASTREGFTKNLYPLAGGRPWTLALAVAALLTAGLGPLLLPIAAAGTGAGAVVFLPLAELAAIRLMAAVVMADHPNTVLLHPAGVLAVSALALASWRRHRRGTVAWKRRTLTHEEP
jgi:GT2 family glycosyltransferase